FETRLVDRDGSVRRTWPSYGIRLPGEPTRIVEENPGRPSHVTTLYDDGRVHRGAHLPGFGTLPTVVTGDGGAVFWRDHALLHLTADGERVERRCATSPHGRPHAHALAGRVPGLVLLSASTPEAHLMLFEVTS